jgi:hypothetical protein
MLESKTYFFLIRCLIFSFGCDCIPLLRIDLLHATGPSSPAKISLNVNGESEVKKVDTSAFEKKILNVINTTPIEKKDVPHVQALSAVSDTGSMNPINLNASQKTATSFLPRSPGIPIGSLPDASSKKPDSPQSTSTTFSPRLDLGEKAGSVVPILGLKSIGSPSPLDLPPPAPITANATATTGPNGQPVMSVKEMIGNIAKRKSSIPVAIDMNRAGNRNSLPPGSKLPPAVITTPGYPDVSGKGLLSDDLRRSGSADPTKKAIATIKLASGRSGSPVSQSGIKKPMPRGMCGNGKWGDGPVCPSDDNRSQRSNSPRDKYERESNDGNSVGGDGLYCASTGRRLGKSPPSEKRTDGPMRGSMPGETGSVRGVVASWDNKADSLVRDTAKSRATKEATIQKELSPGRATLMEKRCTF